LKYAKTLIVGIGSPHGDDQSGWLVARQLAKSIGHQDVTVQIADTPARLLDWVDCDVRLFVCDACRGSGQPGSLRRWTWPDLPCLPDGGGGTHDLGLAQTLGIADQLGKLPRQVIVWTIEMGDSDPLADVTPAVHRAVDQLVKRMLDEIGDLQRHPHDNSSVSNP
jgi:hydrogenase maturation protease